jgi:hypothetical protein
MKKNYEKPKMITETIEFSLLAGGSPAPTAQLPPDFGLCPPCVPSQFVGAEPVVQLQLTFGLCSS